MAADKGNVDELIRKDMAASMSNLFLAEKYSDLTIICGDRHFKVHKAFVCSRSKVFERMFQDGEGAFREAATGEVRLVHDPVIVEKMFSFMYRLTYSDDSEEERWDIAVTESKTVAPKDVTKEENQIASSDPQGPGVRAKGSKSGKSSYVSSVVEGWPEPPETKTTTENVPSESVQDRLDCSPLLLNAQVYTLAEEYDLWALKVLAQDKFNIRVQGDGWKDEGFPEAIREVYEKTPDSDVGLRPVMIKAVKQNIRALKENDDFNNVLKDVPDFTLDLLNEILRVETSSADDPWAAMARRKGLKEGVFCSNCGVFA
ncbi:MAG: hypothetical protein M1827_004781 [Pycnora praestabilis]|nr:MAG: hypothetical protein M1827_004781 [Pycnora praestabilis]